MGRGDQPELDRRCSVCHELEEDCLCEGSWIPPCPGCGEVLCDGQCGLFQPIKEEVDEEVGPV